MEDPTAFSTEEEGRLFNDTDDFTFFDCIEGIDTEESSSSIPSASIDLLSDSNLIKSSPETNSSSTLRRRRPFSGHHRQTLSDEESLGSRMSVTSINSEVTGEVNERGGKNPSDGEVKETDNFDSCRDESGAEKIINDATMEKLEDSNVTSSSYIWEENSGVVGSTSLNEMGEERPDFCVVLASLIIKAIVLHFNLMISLLSFPFWVMWTSYLFLLNPCLTMRRGRDYLLGKVGEFLNFIVEYITPYLSKHLLENQALSKLVIRCGCGLFWSAYVGLLLLSLLVLAFLGGALVMKHLVEEPFRLKQSLNFDFTKNSPVALVPVTTDCPEMPCVNCGETFEMGSLGEKSGIPPNHKVRATVGLVLPESNYNRNLGMFQVRVEFSSSDGKTLVSLSRPCLLHFRSEPVRMLRNLLKIFPLVTGYLSESQTIILKFRRFTGGDNPFDCLRVTLEQRAEFRPASGIPEVYDAFLILESELPFLKSFIWGWRRTIFVWMSMTIFIVELFFALICCHNVLIPSLRIRNAVAQYSGEPGH